MKTLYFKCELLSDVVLNQRAATEGNQESLDFIPGNNFLGIVAGQLYNSNEFSSDEKLKIFHSGKVRFGDAHPEKGGARSLRIPASMYKSKLEGMAKGLYIHHSIPDPDNQEYKDFQPKQCRDGFYLFDEMTLKMEEIKVRKTFAIKSAYDKELRRSADEKMYGYESLEIGSDWVFEVTLDDDVSEKIEKKIKEALVGTRRIGRSRTAQYGLIKINEINYTSEIETIENEDFSLVYADARLIFLDEFGLSTFQPTAEDLGFSEGKIDWGKSQIRTFQYAPWNSKRQTRDADRCGIEKGSVFYIKTKTKQLDSNISFVGVYQNEGFGKIILNPEFLLANQDGKATYTVSDELSKIKSTSNEVSSNNPLLLYLKNQKNEAEKEQQIYQSVNEFVDSNKRLFTKENFASQWGSIRSIAMQYKNKSEIQNALFKPESGYLTHGVAKDKWSEGGRLRKFEMFFDKLDEDIARQSIINLAAEMAKISKGGSQ